MSEEKPKWKRLSEVLELLNGKSRKSNMAAHLNNAMSLGCMDSSLASTLTSIVMDVPRKSFAIYARLIEKACADGCLYGYNAEMFYSRLVNLIEENDERTKFMKSVLRRVDKEVCGSNIALPPNHPYLNNKGD